MPSVRTEGMRIALKVLPNEGGNKAIVEGRMPKLAESFFLELGARIDVTPAMSPEDLQKGLAKLG